MFRSLATYNVAVPQLVGKHNARVLWFTTPNLCLAGCPSVRLQVATQFFVLQVLTVFFASFLTGSLINQLGAFVVDPGGLLRYLGTSESDSVSG